jgi:predicted phage baseplate assembly protein
MRVRVARVRGGGGRAGNLPPGSLSGVSGQRTDRLPLPRLTVRQSVATTGGDDAESLAEAERRIPALFRDGDRAVTEADYRRVAADAPGVRVARVEVLARFKPQQRRSEVPGVVTLMVLPQPPAADERFAAPAPRPDRPFLEIVHAHVDARRPLATELYVVAPDYVPVGVGVSVSVRDGFGRDGVLQGVRDALRALLWPLPTGGPDGAGWPLGRAVRERELEVAVSRVAGVGGVNGISLFTRAAGASSPPSGARR